MCKIRYDSKKTIKNKNVFVKQCLCFSYYVAALRKNLAFVDLLVNGRKS